MGYPRKAQGRQALPIHSPRHSYSPKRPKRPKQRKHNDKRQYANNAQQDYSLRAKDYNEKKAKIKRLQEKANDRNPDEFNFGMMSTHSQKQGRHGAAARDSATARGLTHEAIKLLKTQDAGYLRTVGERVRRQMEKLEKEIKLQEGMGEFLGQDPKSKKAEKKSLDDDDFDFDFDDEEDEGPMRQPKLVFADDRDEQRELKSVRRAAMEKKAAEEDSEDEGEASFGQMQRNQQQKKTQKQLDAERQALREARRARKLRKRAEESRLNKLQALQKQHADITAAERELDWQRGRMDNSVGGTNKNGLKWKIRERKK